jgi:hypothetical protein
MNTEWCEGQWTPGDESWEVHREVEMDLTEAIARLQALQDMGPALGAQVQSIRVVVAMRGQE